MKYVNEIDVEIKLISQNIKELNSTYYKNFKKTGFWLQRATL
jgi:hypothetical protein